MVDTSKNYVCYYCEEEITFSLPPPKIRKTLFTVEPLIKPLWRHVATGMVQCMTYATPSNMTIDQEKTVL